MNDYKFEMRRKKRGEFCLIDKCQFDGDYSRGRSRRGLCGCGTRTPPSKNEKNRLIRRALQRQLRDTIGV